MIKKFIDHEFTFREFAPIFIISCISIVFFSFVAGVIVSGVDLFSLEYWAYGGNGTSRSEAFRNVGILVVAIVGLGFAVWRAKIADHQAKTAQKQAFTAEQTHITGIMNNAVRGLGSEKIVKVLSKTPRYQKDGDDWRYDSKGKLIPAEHPDGTPIIDSKTYEYTTPKLELRIGSIYALERIAQDSPRDHIQVMEHLCAYIRENSPVTSLEPTEPPFSRVIPRTDIQAAISVIGRRSKKQIELEWQHQFRLDFRDTDLSGADFMNGAFSAAMFHGCRLEACRFDDSTLKGTQFFRALLNFSSFFGAEMRGTRFDFAIINRPAVVPGGMTQSINMGNIYGISVVGADLTAIDYLGEPKEMNLTFGSKDTKLDYSLDFDRKSYPKKQHEIGQLNKSGKIADALKEESVLYSNGFVDWFPHDSTDMALGYAHGKFLDKINLTGWPYS
ncbi:MAG: hypothetical protein COB46_14165 [Rhodospirillaceae bacterium]|nr:MAG: hypothetical protein COB46_14165 [Rhodospirillaceae bacterium]